MMYYNEGTAIRRITQSAILTENMLILHSLYIQAGADDVYADLYEGTDAVSGRWLGRFYAGTDPGVQYRWAGLALERGLYVSLGTDVTAVSIEYEIVRQREP